MGGAAQPALAGRARYVVFFAMAALVAVCAGACSGGATSTIGSGGSGGAPGAGSGGNGNVSASGGAGSGGAASGGSSAIGGAASGGRSATGGTASGGAASGGRTATGGTASGGAAAGGATSGPPIVDLFNGTDLTGWTAYRETAATSPGTMLTATQAQQIFKPEGGTIRVYGDAADKSTQARHTLITSQSYSKYNFWVEYRWGTKKFAPYTDLTQYPRDAGVLWHLHADKTQVWPSSIEFQIKDGTTGDIFALYARCTSLARNGGTTFVDSADGGTMKVVNGATGFVQHARSMEFPMLELPEWNALQLQVEGGTAVYIVNGHIVNRVLAVNDKSGSAGMAVTSGPIALQAEHAEVFYRNIRIQVLP